MGFDRARPHASEFRRPPKDRRRLAIPKATGMVRFTFTPMDVLKKLGFNPQRQWRTEGWQENKGLSEKDGSRIVYEMSAADYNALRAKKQHRTDSRAGSKRRPDEMTVGEVIVTIERKKVSGAKMRRELEASAS